MSLHILHLEDSPLDAELVQASLDEASIDAVVWRVDSCVDFEAALRGGPWDLILADYSLPAFDGITAMEFARVARPDVPFLFVTGALGEERAIETLKRGATDYVLKANL